MRKLIIMGPAYCGSTVTCALLSNLPGVCGLGEVHYIIHKGVWWCFRCGHQQHCPVVTPVWKEPGLTFGNLYTRLCSSVRAEYPHAGTLVTTDKAADIVSRSLKPRRADGILLARRPEGFVAGWAKNPDRYDPFRTLPGVYNRLLNWGPSFFRKFAVVNFDRLSSNPEGEVPRICKAFDLPLPERPLVHPPSYQWHNVVGNWEALTHPVRGKEIVPDRYWTHRVPKSLLKRAQEHEGLQRTWARLEAAAI